MPPATNALHAVYSQRMYTTAHGYPLWDGSPEDGTSGIELGMVGYLDDGKLWLLLNSMKPDTPEHQKHGVPPDFEEMELEDNDCRKGPHIKDKVISTESVTEVRMEASASAGVPG